MEELLCDAAMRGDLESLHEIIAKDNYILDKVLVGSFKGKNPLHVATSTGQLEFVLKLLEIKPKLAKVLDTELGAALHIASANGDVKIVEALVELSPEMCMARNQDGNNPLHIAAMEGKVDVLKKLVETCPRAAQVILDREIIGDPKFVHSKDANGNTILHLAIFGKRVEIVKHILDRTTIKVNELNGAGWTAMDINYFFVRNHPLPEAVDRGIRTLLRAVGAQMESQKLLVVSEITPSGQNVVQTFMVVSSLFATMAFQVRVNPPGGVWIPSIFVFYYPTAPSDSYATSVLAAAIWMAREMVCRLARDGPRLPSAVGENVSSTV
ncbi:ankyrin repeat-containing protein BDA1-like [Rhododendron vialii]|uniref:ankyrin repeat-containing protein BDA1-like n=1 Tax=Rhododendron vialii TaxID=182163 RepID=UPI00265FA314|nr:ankyrin repeat-containing protein BDA1-like [Rhododendron vialii]